MTITLAEAAIEYELARLKTDSTGGGRADAEIECLVTVLRMAAVEIAMLRSGDLIRADLLAEIDRLVALYLIDPIASLQRIAFDMFNSETRRGWIDPKLTREEYVARFIEQNKNRDLDELETMADIARPSNMPTAHEREIAEGQRRGSQ